MKVKKGSQQLRKGSRINRKRLRTLFFPYNFSVKPLRFPFGVQRLSLYTTEARSAELCGWMDGWMDGWVGGDLLPLLIFVIFKYDNKQNELHPKTCLKVAFAY